MAQGKIELKHNFTGEPGIIILNWKKTSNLLAEVGRQRYDPAHTQQTLIIENLDPVLYLVTAYRSSDGVALDEQINQLAVDARIGAIYPVERFEYVVNRGDSGPEWSDPVEGSVELRDTRLKDGKYWVEERGTGSMSITEYTDRSDDGGGFDWTNGKTFEGGVHYFVYLMSKVDLADTITPSADETDIILLENDMDYNPATMNAKLIVANGNQDILEFVIPNLLIIPNSRFTLNTHGGNQKFVAIQFDPGDEITFLGEAKNRIILGKGEEIKIAFIANVPYVLFYNGDHRRVGERLGGEKDELNTIKAIGTEYSITSQPRLYYEHIAKLPASQIRTYAEWDQQVVSNGVNTYINRGFYAVNLATQKFKVPDLRNTSERYLRYTDATVDDERLSQGPGGFQDDEVRSHVHNFEYKIGKSDQTESGTSSDFMRKSTAGGSNFGLDNQDTESFGGSETRVKNHGLIPLIKV